MKPAQIELGLAADQIDYAGLVKFYSVEQGRYWVVEGGDGKWRGKVGLDIGRLEIKNSRCFAVVLRFEDRRVHTFNPMDLRPDTSA